jgi:hypothetical protein
MDFADFEADPVSYKLDLSAQRILLLDSVSTQRQNSHLFALFGINANEMVASGASACGFVYV